MLKILMKKVLLLKKLIPNNSSIILVTSAFHMHRSKYLFEKQGFKVIPFPVDFKSSTTKISIFSFLPNLGSNKKKHHYLLRENIGRFIINCFYNQTFYFLT